MEAPRTAVVSALARLSHDQDRRRGFLNDALRRRAEPESLDPAATVRARHDQSRASLLGRLDDAFDRVGPAHQRLGLESGLDERRGAGIEAIVGVVPESIELFLDEVTVRLTADREDLERADAKSASEILLCRSDVPI